MKASNMHKLLRAIEANPDSRFEGKLDQMQALINEGLIAEYDGIITADEHPGIAYKYRLTPKGREWMNAFQTNHQKKIGKVIRRIGEAASAILTIAELIQKLWP